MIQVVMVKWGDRYPAYFVNAMVRNVARYSSESVRFVCITDDHPDAFDRGIVVKEFPDYGLPARQMNHMKSGCRLKLSMFHPGIVDPDLPTLFFDLDTAIVGDVVALAACLRRRPALYMLPNHWVKHWSFRAVSKPLFPGRYYFGNSSVMGFYPGAFTDLLPRFSDAFTQAAAGKATCPLMNKALISDERFLSYYADGFVRTFPGSLACKFASEYMFPLTGRCALYNALPHVQKRRRQHVAVTFHGPVLKPARIITYEKGQSIQYKDYAVRWSDEHKPFYDYWLSVIEGQS